ncbi:MAG: hypothetical protein MPW15_05345 [Candidatus Manganitrophus sp.]|nr:hypothetical protein [Candidatus Manganitrophus sp.]
MQVHRLDLFDHLSAPLFEGLLGELLRFFAPGGALRPLHQSNIIALAILELIHQFERFGFELFFVLLHNLEFFLRHGDDVADRNLIGLELFSERQHLLDGDRKPEDDVGDLFLPLLDPLRDLDLPLPRKKRHRADLTEIKANRIVGPADRAGGQIDLLFPLLADDLFVDFLDLLDLFDLFVRFDRHPLEPAGLLGVDHFDIHLAEHHHNMVELIGGEHIGRKGVVQFLIREEAFLFA